MSTENVATPANRRAIVALTIGIWLFFAPGFLHYNGELAKTLTTVATGAALIVIAGMAVRTFASWKTWTIAVLGAWVIAMPWLAGFADTKTAVLNSLVCGTLTLGAALVDLYLAQGKGHGKGKGPGPIHAAS